MKLKTTLDQWIVLKAVIEQGGFAQAAEFLHRSQSTVSYAVSQLQFQLGVKILQVEGRKAALTPIGKILYHRAQVLLDNAKKIEKIAFDTHRGGDKGERLTRRRGDTALDTHIVSGRQGEASAFTVSPCQLVTLSERKGGSGWGRSNKDHRNAAGSNGVVCRLPGVAR